MEEMIVCTHCWAKSPKGPAVCPYCQTPFPVAPERPATPQEMGFTSKQIDHARKLYNRCKKRPGGYRIWLLLALLWGGIGYFGYTNGSITGEGNILAKTILIFGGGAIVMLLLFFLGNKRSKRIYAQRRAQLKTVDPRLIKFFAFQDDYNAHFDENYIPDQKAIDDEEKEKREEKKAKEKLEDIWIYGG